MYIEKDAKASIEGCVIGRSEEHAISIHGQCTAERVTIIDSKMNGIHVWDTGAAQLVDCDVKEAQGDGICVEGSATASGTLRSCHNHTGVCVQGPSATLDLSRAAVDVHDNADSDWEAFEGGTISGMRATPPDA